MQVFTCFLGIFVHFLVCLVFSFDITLFGSSVIGLLLLRHAKSGLELLDFSLELLGCLVIIIIGLQHLGDVLKV